MSLTGYLHFNSDSGGLNMAKESQGEIQGGQKSKNVKGIGNPEMLPQNGSSGPP